MNPTIRIEVQLEKLEPFQQYQVLQAANDV